MNSIRANSFTPWHVDYWFGIGWLVAGMMGGWALVFLEWRLFGAALAIWCSVRGWARVARGLARERGVEVERRAFVQFLHTMEHGEFAVQADVPMLFGQICFGNVDLVVSPVWSRASYAVEIKSYSGIVRRWYGLCRVDRFYRLWSPQKQVRRQCRYLGRRWHFPVLWIPESPLGNWFIDGGILVVNGGAHLLIEGLRYFDTLIRLPVVVRFQFPPGSGYTGFLRERRFIYDGGRFCWHGVESRRDVEVLAEVVKGAGGRVEWVGR